MTTARRPPQPPTPRQTRPLAQPKPQARPLTTEIIQRIRRVVEKSDGAITYETMAAEMGASRAQIAEWVGGYRSAPNSESMIQLCRWLAKRDATFLKQVFMGRTVKSIGRVDRLDGNGGRRKLTEESVREIKRQLGTVTNAELGRRHDVDPKMITRIQNGTAWKHVTI